MSDLYLDTNPTSPATPQALKRTDVFGDPNQLTLAEISMFGGGTTNQQGVIVLRTLNPGALTGLVERMRIHTNGNVGIGVPAPTPTQALEVAGTVRATAFQGNGSALTGISDPSRVSKVGDTMTGALSVTAAGTGLSITNHAAVGGTLTVGKVGIGTPAPGAGLEINKGATNDLALLLSASGPGWGSGLQLKNTSSQYGGTYGIYAGSGGAAVPGGLQFADVDAGAIRMTINKDGNVGIGTTGPQGMLDVRVPGIAGWDRIVVTASNAWDGGAKRVLIGGGVALMLESPHVPWNPRGSASIAFGRSGGVSTGVWWDAGVRGGNAFSIVCNDYNNHKLWLDAGGNVGIGTTAPLSTLTVGGANASLRITSQGHGENGYVFENDNADNFKLKLRYKNPTNVYSELMTFEYNGNIGIGTTTPGAKLDVSGDILVSGNRNVILRRGLVVLGTTDGSQAASGEVVGAIGFVGYGPQHGQLAFRAGMGFELVDCSRDYPRIGYASGSYPYANLTAGYLYAQNMYWWSDARSKDEIEGVSEALDKVLRLRAVSFRWKDDPTKTKEKQKEQTKEIGLLAQEVQAVCPEVVSDDGQGHLSLAYGSITALLLQAVKEQAAQIQALTQKVSDLEQQLVKR